MRTHKGKKESSPSVPVPHLPTAQLTDTRLRNMTTDELVKLLMSPELAQTANFTIKQQIITILQEREGNEFVRRLLGLSPNEEVD
jgi:hypothetical protein